MRAVIQRVRRASVELDGVEATSIGSGLLVLIGFSAQGASNQLAQMAHRIVNLRVFDDASGRLNRSLSEVAGELLVIPQVTLTARLAKGTRPSFHTAAAATDAHRLFDEFIQRLRSIYPRVKTGVFQAQMVVHLDNDGPVTMVLDE